MRWFFKIMEFYMQVFSPFRPQIQIVYNMSKDPSSSILFNGAVLESKQSVLTFFYSPLSLVSWPLDIQVCYRFE